MELKVGFSKPKAKWKILSNLICWVQGWNKASHTYLVLWDSATQQEIVFHAAFPKVSLIPKSEFIKDNKIYEEVNICLDKHASFTDCIFIEEYVWSMIYNSLNKPYSIMQLFLILWKLITGKNYKVKNPDAAYICTEIISKLMVDIGLYKESETQTKTVKDIYKVCKFLKQVRKKD